MSEPASEPSTQSAVSVFTVFGLPDVHDLCRRVLVGDVGGVRSASRCTADAACRVVDQAGALAGARQRLLGSWSGGAAEQAGRTLTGYESTLRRQAGQLVAGAGVLDDAAAALEQAQGQARLVEAQANALQLAFDAGLGALLGAAGAPLAMQVAEFLAPFRPDSLLLAAHMGEVIGDYQRALRGLAAELDAEKGVVRPDAGPEDVGDDPVRRRAALYRGVVGVDPVTADDWAVAAALDPHVGDPRAADLPANVVVVRIEPAPGAGVVRGDAFIATATVVGFPPNLANRGDGRSFDPAARPDQSRAFFLVDYERGVAVVRQNPSHDEGEHVSRVGDPVVGIEQDAAGRVRLRLDEANPLAPRPLADLGWSVRGDLVIDPRGGPGGRASVDGVVSQFPSWEVYQGRPDGSAVPLLRREQNGGGPVGPLLNLPLDTTPVGEHPDRLGNWLRGHHPDQGGGPLDDLDEYSLPLFPAGDPWYDFPLPATPYPTADRRGGVQVPAASRVG